MKRSGQKSAAQTPAPIKDRVYGSTKNPKESAKSKSSGKSINFTDKIITGLKNKVEDYNEKHPKDKVSLSTLKAVYRRGSGAYSSSHRPTITGGVPNSRSAWSFARVNKFLQKKAGNKVKKAYVQDDDLMRRRLIAPNGNKSNLTPKQYKLVRTSEFKAWFGDWENDPKNASKVVDENGEPLVVYRGWSSNKRLSNIYSYDVNMFGSQGISGRSRNQFGFYFSGSKSVAKGYAKDFTEEYNTDLDYKKSTKKRALPIVQGYFLNIRNICNISPSNPKFPSLDNFIEISKKENGSWMSFKEIKNRETKLYPTEIGVKSLCKIIGVTKKDVEHISSEDGYLLRKYNSNSPKAIYDYFINNGNGYDSFFKYKIEENNYDGVLFQEYTYWGSELSAKEIRDIDRKDDKLESEVRNYPNVFVAFEPNQIKLADGTNTTFYAENPDVRFAEGGDLGQEITCVNCGWNWNTNQSDVSDKYVCHKCGFDNRTFYDSDPIGKLKKPHTVIEIAEKHKLPVSNVTKVLKLGIGKEKEHTKDPKIARTIALQHLWESPKYYQKLNKMEKSFKDGGEVAHISGKAGGVLVGRRHSEGGIKAVNKSNNQPLEMEGGEVVITRNAVSDGEKREFEGEMLTNREILSRINESGGGVSFAKGGSVKNCGCTGKNYKYGGKMMSDFDIVNQINSYSELPKQMVTKSFDMTGVRYADLKPSEALRKLFGHDKYESGGVMEDVKDSLILATKKLPSLKGFVKSKKSVKSPYEGEDALYSPVRHHYAIIFFKNGDDKSEKITKSEAYKTFLFDEYGIKFKDLPSKIQNALMIGNQKLIDNYINN